jgi:hypothetical protein
LFKVEALAPYDSEFFRTQRTSMIEQVK